MAADIPTVTFILDCSGSMGVKAGDQTKMQAAKEVMEYSVSALPAEVNIGLAAYGHRRKGDCADLDMLVSPGNNVKDEILSKVRNLKPVGMTPIAASVEMVLNTAAARDTEALVVLISDGEETCHKDPCGAIKALKNSGKRFILHVVGFGITKDEEMQLRCLADAGGGKFFPAADAKGLLAALESVRKDVELKVEQAKTKKVRAASRLGKLSVKLPETALQSIAGLKIVRTDDNKVVKEAKVIDEIHPLSAGNYRLILGFANPNYKQPTEVSIGEAEVKGGGTTEISLGAVVINMAQGLGKAAWRVGLVNEKTGKPYLELESHGNDYYLMKPKAAPEGIYSLAFTYARSEKPCIVAKGLTVKPGKETVATLDSGIALKKTQASVQGWDVMSSGTSEPVLEVRRRWDNDYPLWESFPLPPGTYDITVHLKGMKEPLLAGEGVEIKKGETVVFDSGL